MNGFLPYRVWLPYDAYSIPLFFWILSVHQIVTVIFVTVINVGTETIVFGFILQTCAQIEIFQNRLRKLIINKTATHTHGSYVSPYKKTASISEYICYHLSIYKLVIYLRINLISFIFINFTRLKYLIIVD